MKNSNSWLILLTGAVAVQLLVAAALYVRMGTLNENVSGLYQTIAGLSAGSTAMAMNNNQTGMVQKVLENVETGSGPVRGEGGAAVTIVEFSDFSCSACKSAQSVLKELVDESEGSVRLAYRHFPGHESQEAAMAAECASNQDAFWPMHDLIFADSKDFGNRELRAHAARLNLDMDVFEECMESGEVKRRIEDDMQAGRLYGVLGTPTLFINGRMVIGSYPRPALEELIDRIRNEDGA